MTVSAGDDVDKREHSSIAGGCTNLSGHFGIHVILVSQPTKFWEDRHELLCLAFHYFPLLKWFNIKFFL